MGFEAFFQFFGKSVRREDQCCSAGVTQYIEPREARSEHDGNERSATEQGGERDQLEKLDCYRKKEHRKKQISFSSWEDDADRTIYEDDDKHVTEIGANEAILDKKRDCDLDDK